MKVPRLNETDLARFAVMNPERREAALKRHKSGFAPYSLEPARSQFAEIMNCVGDLLSPIPVAKTKLETIEASILRKCTKDDAKANNLEVVRLLFEHFQQLEQPSRKFHFPTLKIGSDHFAKYWLDFFSIEDGRPTAIFVDPRGSKGLSPEARRLVFSMQHIGIRQFNPDFENARLNIIQLARSGEKRSLRLYSSENIELMPYEEALRLVAETYEIWADINSDRERVRRPEVRKTGTGQGSFWP